MDDARTREAEIFAEALRRPVAERPQYLTQVCGADAALRERLEELLKVHDRVGDFLETPNAESGFSIASAAPEEARGRVGRYRLIEKIGEGGCGVVYRAEQDEPVRREVALKIIKPGMDTKEVIARFEAERQALAMMDHPGIAKVFDAGQTDSGRPFFVMELIRGVKITDYCDQHLLPTEERLKLFVQVCHAIQHAHQKGIIHRDIKPSNILVTTDAEGAPQPVVIDFGIAKATVGIHLTDKTLFTAVDMLIGTPTYMSPEQTTASRGDVDTRTDIYSLGVLLYELLTGTTPFDAGELLQLGIDEVRRAIREQEPVRPSARVSRMSDESLTTVAKRRRSEPPTLIRTLRGDLDWIAMKALEKDRARRYDTANGLALDVDRFLADEAVAARPASTFYRFRKTVARNRLLFVSLAAIAGVLVAGLIAVSISLSRERRARLDEGVALDLARTAQARAEKERAAAQAAALETEQTSKFLLGMLEGIRPETARRKDTTLLKEILDQAAARVDTELATAPAVQLRLYDTIGNVYRQLGLTEEALRLLRARIALARKVHGNDSPELASALQDIGPSLLFVSRWKEAEDCYRELLEIQRRRFGTAPSAEVALALRGMAGLFWQTSREEEAEKLMRESWGLLRRMKGENAPETISALYSVAVMQHWNDNFAESEQLLRQVIAARKAQPDNTQGVGQATLALAETLTFAGKNRESLAAHEEALRIFREIHPGAHPSVVDELGRTSVVLFRLGRFAEAEALNREAVAMAAATTGPESELHGQMCGYLAEVLEARGQLEEAEKLAWEYQRLCEKLYDRGNYIRAVPYARLLSIFTTTRRFEEADRLLAEQLPADFAATPESGPLQAVATQYLARRGRWSEALHAARLASGYRQGPVSSEHFLRVLMVANRDPGTRAFNRASIARFGSSREGSAAAYLAVDCLLLPDPELDLAAVRRLADLAVAAGMDSDSANDATLAQALVAFRQGDLAAALEWATKLGQNVRPNHRIEALAVRAMVLQRQEKLAEARAALAEARQIAARRLPDAESGDVGPTWISTVEDYDGIAWNEWIVVRTLLTEAEDLVGSEEIVDGGPAPLERGAELPPRGE